MAISERELVLGGGFKGVCNCKEFIMPFTCGSLPALSDPMPILLLSCRSLIVHWSPSFSIWHEDNSQIVSPDQPDNRFFCNGVSTERDMCTSLGSWESRAHLLRSSGSDFLHWKKGKCKEGISSFAKPCLVWISSLELLKPFWDHEIHNTLRMQTLPRGSINQA